VIDLRSACGRIVVAASLAACGAPAAARAAQARPPGPPSPTAATSADPETNDTHPAPVLIGGEPIIWVTAGVGPYTPEYRADRIASRVEDAVHDRSLRDPTVTVTEVDGSSELRAGARLLMVVTARDAASVGVARASLAQQNARALEEAIRVERWRYAPSTLLRSGIYGLLATLAFGAVVWLIQRLTRGMRAVAARRLTPRAAESLRAIEAEILSPSRVGLTIDGVIRALRAVLVLLAFDLYLTYVLGLFPWTRAVSVKLLDYLLTPIRAVAAAFVGYLPKFLFLIVIAAAFYVAIRAVGLFFRQIQRGRLVFASFPAEWADPTNKIARVLLIAFALVVAFPYLPASDSPAFAGVSVFMGVLFSLASSSAISNMIAGIVLTYTRAFRLGDRVKLGGAFGDIVETTLLATHVRTIKNEEITIPNSIALGSTVTNYSRMAGTSGLILHTSVTIGYDAPWRKVHDLLIEAALATPGVLNEPRPFVWQTALNDFYVTYEINAYTASPRDMIDTYAALHSRIQDAFYAAGVEIMSPHYTALRDGNTVAIPESARAPGYEARAFRVEDVAGSRQRAGTGRSG
jgi:small-conductance mechanosensitive channel